MILTLIAVAPTPEITGTIVDGHAKPVPGISISAVALPSSLVIAKTVSGPDGSFNFTGLARGGYGIEAKSDSACAFSDAIQVDDGFTSVVRLLLVKGLCQNPVELQQPPVTR
ncbi:MAG TPA: carboxypeptidase-like regulatory domain-containing protein [Candidatus Cybelea sp.]|nr:carboxypeptidase-like regulatory domain-containing protein [Candidatus Cybelea sp.]